MLAAWEWVFDYAVSLWQWMQEKQQLVYDIVIYSIYLRHNRESWYQVSRTRSRDFSFYDEYYILIVTPTV